MRRAISKKTDGESGNVLFLILIACALFAALTYVVSNSTRTGSGSVSMEKAKILASALTQFGNSIEVAVGRLLLAGCAEDQISFATPTSMAWPTWSARYDNVNSPTDNKCHVFDARGGGVVFPVVDTDLLGEYPNPYFDEGYGYVFTGSMTVPGIGTFNMGDDQNTVPNSMAVVLPYVQNDVCNAINRGLGIDLDVKTMVVQDDPMHIPRLFTGIAFYGDFGGYPITVDTIVTPALFRQRTGCYHMINAGEDYNIYYHIVLPR